MARASFPGGAASRAYQYMPVWKMGWCGSNPNFASSSTFWTTTSRFDPQTIAPDWKQATPWSIGVQGPTTVDRQLLLTVHATPARISDVFPVCRRTMNDLLAGELDYE